MVKPLEQRLRPRGLGLGAEPAPPPSSSGPPNSGGGGRREDPHSSTGGGLRVGDDVRIQSGPHRGVCGKVSVNPSPPTPKNPILSPRNIRWGGVLNRGGVSK